MNVEEKAKELEQKNEETQKTQQKLAESLGKLDDAEKKVKWALSGAREFADGLLDALNDLGDLAGGEGSVLIAEKNIEAINTVLLAVGSGQANAEGLQDERLTTAVAWVEENVPSLAADMAALLDQAKAPPVSNLILELQHQTIEENYAKALIALSEKRIEILRARYHKLVGAAGAWRGFRD